MQDTYSVPLADLRALESTRTVRAQKWVSLLAEGERTGRMCATAKVTEVPDFELTDQRNR